MSSTFHDSKPRLASLHSGVSDGGFAMSAVGLPTEGTVDEYEDEEDSPYEEVRASVSNMDDPEMPVLTLRMWLIGIFLTVGSAAVNTFFNFRSPQIYVISLPVLCVARPTARASASDTELVPPHPSRRLIAYPLGRFAATVLPIRQYRLPTLLGGGQFSFNPGPSRVYLFYPSYDPIIR
jgi:OPT oligopeptide transporter protein